MILTWVSQEIQKMWSCMPYSCWEIVSQSPTPARTMSFLLLLAQLSHQSLNSTSLQQWGAPRLIMEAIIGMSGPEGFSRQIKWPKARDGIYFSLDDSPLVSGNVLL